MYKADPDNDKKQQPKQITRQNPSFVPVFATDALAKVANPVAGTLTFSKEKKNLFWLSSMRRKY